MHYPSDVLAGMVIGWAAAMLVTHLGASWIDRLVSLLSRISDPLLKPIWDRIPSRAPAPYSRRLETERPPTTRGPAVADPLASI